MTFQDAERRRLDEDARREKNWKRWGPYLAERQWGTVREDYSAGGSCWEYFPHDHARSRVYRWGEDGLMGLTDREGRLCFALALWNGRDPILKERLFGLTGPEGNHGEDVKELYYYLDATPTASYLRALYKYPQAEFPYARLVEENRQRGKRDRELELEDTGIFDDGRYFDLLVEYAKASPDDILIRITATNRGPDPATLHLLPTLWLRNTWAWGRTGEGYWPKGRIARGAERMLVAEHPSLGRYRLACDRVEPRLRVASTTGSSEEPLIPSAFEGRADPRFLFTDNETNSERLYSSPNASPFVKDAFHRLVVDGEPGAVNPAEVGTKAAAWWRLELPPRGEAVVRLRLTAEAEATSDSFGAEFERVFGDRKAEADAFYALHREPHMTAEERAVVRQADAGLVWSKQLYLYDMGAWLDGDPAQPAPAPEREEGRNRRWRHLYARDVISMPDGWEYPWFAAWDLAFHCVAFARIDPAFAKEQLLLLTREWYMNAAGALPAYEFNFSDVNPPVQAWAAWRVYQLSAQAGFGQDRDFLERAFQKCVVNFTWWVNRKDLDGDNLFTGGFLGLDNIGVFDRSRLPPGLERLEQADATAWMAFYCSTMLAIALELAREDPVYGDLATKFFEHFVTIAVAMNELGGSGLWDEEDGFYYDQASVGGEPFPLRVRSMVGLIPLLAAETLDWSALQRLPDFERRLEWFLKNEPQLAHHVAVARAGGEDQRLLSIPTRERLVRVLRYLLDESEFLSPYGIRSLSRFHAERPYVLDLDGERHEVGYNPGESESGLFGGNSNWRGPVWMPVNYLLVEALKRHHHFYGDSLAVECPTGSGRMVSLRDAAEEIERRLATLFLPGPDGRRPCHAHPLYQRDPAFRDLVLFYEHFHGETGRGLGASHQTGWTALAGNVVERVAAARARRANPDRA